MVATRLTLALWSCSATAHAFLTPAGPGLRVIGTRTAFRRLHLRGMKMAAAGSKEAGSFDDPEMASVYSTMAAQNEHPLGPWHAILSEVLKYSRPP